MLFFPAAIVPLRANTAVPPRSNQFKKVMVLDSPLLGSPPPRISRTADVVISDSSLLGSNFRCFFTRSWTLLVLESPLGSPPPRISRTADVVISDSSL
eukprot:CAMPEP_0171820808 /NCGR_PEP_ID=MMETSP0992-20121227/2977_1 /TAXON_ID=483369 /ORGANISM="non described non described, Strain CCMP2098" /LENGTH=97 /DNA_ID=CAMNT_0012435249 /DNA_START=581 /DNA_END=871 /DNA_ORIENTATION=-